MRIHIALNVRDLEASKKFYERLFNQPPTKVRPDYVKFEVADPAVNFTLNPASEVQRGTISHFGIQLKSVDEVRAARDRIRGAGLPIHAEEQNTCCYAEQYKVWLLDPDRNEWEFFVVLDPEAAVRSNQSSECCLR